MLHEIEKARVWLIQFRAKSSVKKHIDKEATDDDQADYQIAKFLHVHWKISTGKIDAHCATEEYK